MINSIFMEISIFFSPPLIRFFRLVYLNFLDLNGSRGNLYFSNSEKERRKFKFSSRVKISSHLLICLSRSSVSIFMEISIFFSPPLIRFFRLVYLNFSDLNGSRGNLYFSNSEKERRKFKFSSWNFSLRVKISSHLLICLIFSFCFLKLFGFEWIEEEFIFFEFGKGKEKI